MHRTSSVRLLGMSTCVSAASTKLVDASEDSEVQAHVKLEEYTFGCYAVSSMLRTMLCLDASIDGQPVLHLVCIRPSREPRCNELLDTMSGKLWLPTYLTYRPDRYGPHVVKTQEIIRQSLSTSWVVSIQLADLFVTGEISTVEYMGEDAVFDQDAGLRQADSRNQRRKWIRQVIRVMASVAAEQAKCRLHRR